MARVNVETRALAETRLSVLMRKMKWRRSTAIGALVILWHDSQERMKVRASKREILGWIDAESDDEANAVFDAFIEAGYVSAEADDVFRIHGNDKHVAAHLVRTAAATKAGTASGKTRKNKQIERLPTPRSIRANGLQRHVQKIEPNSMQFNAVQNNSKQNNSKQEELKSSNPPSALTATPSDEISDRTNWVWSTWESYRAAYHDRYGIDPPVNSGGKRHLGLIKQLLGKIPPEHGPGVARFYVFHNDAVYVRARHSLEPLVLHAMGLASQWQAGTVITGNQARQVEQVDHHRSQLIRISQGEL